MDNFGETIAGYSLVGVLVVAILIVLLCLLLSKCKQQMDSSKHGRKSRTNKTSKHQKSVNGDSNSPHSQGCVRAPVVEDKVTEIKVESNVEHESKLKVKEEEKQKKLFFPLSNRGIFLKSYNVCSEKCVYVADEVKMGIFVFDLVSMNRAKAWDISEAVVNVGKVLQQDAVGFKCKKKGQIVQKEENGRVYWQIKEKLEVEYLK